MALKLKGSTSGFVGLDAPAVAGNNTLILPENAGSAHQILANDITAGVTTFTRVTVSRNGDLTVPGTISIGGTLTYEDVTSVDSVGIVTARGLSIFGNTTGLNATGISTFGGSVGIADSIIHTGDTDTSIRFPSANTISFESAGSESFRVDSSGKLLIGQTSDSDGQVCMAGVLAFSAGGSGTASGANARPNISRGTNGQLILAAGKDAASTIRFDVAADASTNAAEVMLIAADGNIGINNSSPSYKLSVNGDSGINVTASSNDTHGVLSVVGRNSSGSTSAISRFKSYPEGSSNQSHFAIETRNSSNTLVEALRISSSQKVGIGSTQPTYALEVNGGTQNTVIAAHSSDAKAAISFLDNTSGGYGRATVGGEGDEVYITSGAGIERLRITSSGNAQFTGIVSTTTGQFVTPNTTGSLAARNRIDNGAMEIAQRGGSETTIDSSTEECVVDRWFARSEPGDSFLYDQDSSAPYGFKSSLKFNCASTSSGGSNELHTITQAIEGNMIADFGFGGGNARAIAVSFWVKSSLTGDFGGALQNSARNRSFNFVYAIYSADSWEYKTILVPAPTSGTWLNDTGVGIRLIFDMGNGSNFRGNAGSWLSADTRGPSGAVSPMQTNNSVWRVTGVQLEMGPAATPFEYVGYDRELQNCQRYFQFIGSGFITAGRGASSSMYLYSYTCPVNLRASPTISTNNNIAHGTFSVRRYRDGSGVSDSTTTPATNSTYFKANNNTIHLQQDGFSATDDRSATIFISGGSITLSSEIS